MKHCQQCNLDFPDSFRFCGSCGGAIRDSLSCQGCGELVESKWTFCTNCGREFSSESPAVQASRPKTPEPTDVPAAPLPPSSTPRTPPPPTLTMSSSEQPAATARQRPEQVMPQEWYAAPDLLDETTETTATRVPRRDLVPKTTVAVPTATPHPQSGNGKAPPSLTMLAAYGESRTDAASEWQRRHALLVGLLLLVFFGALGFGGWYWWTHRVSVAQSPPQAAATSAPAVADSSSSASAASSATTSTGRITTGGGADEEWKRLREKRIGAKPSETGEIIAAFENAERKYPNDYRFPYERAKLSIKGITTHHEAFGALELAGEKAIDNGKAQEMLDSLMADKDGDFYKPSHGHREWAVLVQALSNKDKKGLNELHH